MNSTQPSLAAKPATPWLEHDEWQDTEGLIGNRAGFEWLHSHLHRLLTEGQDPVWMEAEGVVLRVLKLEDAPPASDPPSHDLSLWIILPLVLAMPLLACYGLYHLVHEFLL